MKRSNTRLLILLTAILALSACGKRETSAAGGSTETIAPAQPQPAPTGTDAMTQTVDVEHGRSEAEGGALAPAGTMTDTALDTAAATGTTGSAPPTTTTR